MSRSGQAFVAATQGHQFTMYSMMRMMGIPLTKEQQACQEYLERTYPAVVDEPPFEDHTIDDAADDWKRDQT